MYLGMKFFSTTQFQSGNQDDEQIPVDKADPSTSAKQKAIVNSCKPTLGKPTLGKQTSVIIEL